MVYRSRLGPGAALYTVIDGLGRSIRAAKPLRPRTASPIRISNVCYGEGAYYLIIRGTKFGPCYMRKQVLPGGDQNPPRNDRRKDSRRPVVIDMAPAGGTCGDYPCARATFEKVTQKPPCPWKLE